MKESTATVIEIDQREQQKKFKFSQMNQQEQQNYYKQLCI